jgi:hypothetical protein
MCVLSTVLGAGELSDPFSLFITLSPRTEKEESRCEDLKAQCSIIPSANLENHRVYLFNIIYANFFPPPHSPNIYETLFDAVLHME